MGSGGGWEEREEIVTLTDVRVDQKRARRLILAATRSVARRSRTSPTMRYSAVHYVTPQLVPASLPFIHVYRSRRTDSTRSPPPVSLLQNTQSNPALRNVFLLLAHIELSPLSPTCSCCWHILTCPRSPLRVPAAGTY